MRDIGCYVKLDDGRLSNFLQDTGRSLKFDKYTTTKLTER